MNESKQEDIVVERENEEINIKELRNKKQKSSLGKRILYLFLFFVFCVLFGFGVARYIVSLGQNNELMDKLRNFKPKLVTKVYDIHGEVIGTFAREKRELISYDDIPKSFVEALVAVEDSRFFVHVGVDPLGIIRAAISDLITMRASQGASTITMQLVRQMTGRKEKSIKRKITEALLAIQIERMFTKEEIFERYANQVYFGRGLYGLQAASRYYFGKDAAELTIPESAFLAGLVQAPSRYSPTRNIKLAKKRRDHVLKRMLEEEYITEEQYEDAVKTPLVLPGENKAEEERVGAYFLEEVRKYLYEKYGAATVLDDGLNVYTTLDLRLQKKAEEAVKKGLKALDKRQGFRVEDKKFVKKEEIETYWSPTWNKSIEEGDTVEGVIVKSDEKSAIVRIKDFKIKIGKYEIVWTKAKKVNEILQPGDVVLFKIHKFDPENKKFNISLDQEPKVEGALLAINHHSGEILAMVGGYSFKRSKFNRAIQAKRQTGSVFKPILYGAAFDSAFTLADTFFDEPTVFLDPRLFYIDEYGNIQKYELSEEYKRKIREGEVDEPEPYEPKNYYHEYDGLITLRTALEKSKNIVSVKLFNRIGYKKIRSFAKKLGIKEKIAPYLSSALGSTDLTLFEVCRAYGTIANLGVTTEPFFIRKVTDRYGNTLEEQTILSYRAISPETAYITLEGMRGVIEHGTGRRAKQLNWNLCGKTGTTDNYTDAWFVGSDPNITLGVWVGFDLKQTLGEKETGARAALPIWIDFMKEYVRHTVKTDWPVPKGIVRVPIDKRSGLLANIDAGCKPQDIILEAFKKGTQPVEKCSKQIHEILALPYYEQHGKNIMVDPKTGEIKPNIEFIIYH